MTQQSSPTSPMAISSSAPSQPPQDDVRIYGAVLDASAPRMAFGRGLFLLIALGTAAFAGHYLSSDVAHRTAPAAVGLVVAALFLCLAIATRPKGLYLHERGLLVRDGRNANFFPWGTIRRFGFEKVEYKPGRYRDWLVLEAKDGERLRFEQNLHGKALPRLMILACRRIVIAHLSEHGFRSRSILEAIDEADRVASSTMGAELMSVLQEPVRDEVRKWFRADPVDLGR